LASRLTEIAAPNQKRSAGMRETAGSAPYYAGYVMQVIADHAGLRHSIVGQLIVEWEKMSTLSPLFT